MIRCLGIDIETTGLDWKKERVLELGISLHVDNDPVYLHQATWTMWDEDIQARLPLSPEIRRLTGIRDEALSEFGIHPSSAYRELDQYCADHHVDYLVGHNAHNFDRPFILHELDTLGIEASHFRKTPWLDTRRDIPYLPEDEPKQRSLEHLLMRKRFVPAIAHRALADAANTLWLLSHYDLNEVIEYAKIPWKVVTVPVHYEERELAKAQGYSWQELNYKIYPKSWVKLVKENALEAEAQKFPAHPLRVIE